MVLHMSIEQTTEVLASKDLNLAINYYKQQELLIKGNFWQFRSILEGLRGELVQISDGKPAINPEVFAKLGIEAGANMGGKLSNILQNRLVPKIPVLDRLFDDRVNIWDNADDIYNSNKNKYLKAEVISFIVASVCFSLMFEMYINISEVINSDIDKVIEWAIPLVLMTYGGSIIAGEYFISKYQNNIALQNLKKATPDEVYGLFIEALGDNLGNTDLRNIVLGKEAAERIDAYSDLERISPNQLVHNLLPMVGQLPTNN
jgi:hypothetical protein